MENKINFGVSGIPISTQNSNYINGLIRVAELGLDAYELDFVRFVNMSEQTAQNFFKTLQEIKEKIGKDIKISVHAPYFVNLNAEDNLKIQESINRILKSAERGAMAGATNIVFHPGFYLKSTREETFVKMLDSFETMLNEYLGIFTSSDRKPILRPETTGKVNQFGSIDELIKLSNAFDNVLPCVDFAHLHARANGANNSYDEVISILQQLKNGLGDRLIKNMHIHYSGIEYTDKGERKHLKLNESDANYKEIFKALKDFGVEGNVICESPGMEDDAILMQQTYLNI